MTPDRIERQVGHWLSVTVAPPDGQVVHQCLLCGFEVACRHIDPSAPLAFWVRELNADIRRVRAAIAQHDQQVHPEEVLAQQFAEFRNELHCACDALNGLQAYEWPDTAVRWKLVDAG